MTQGNFMGKPLSRMNPQEIKDAVWIMEAWAEGFLTDIATLEAHRRVKEFKRAVAQDAVERKLKLKATAVSRNKK
jgi:hypothetical protein